MPDITKMKKLKTKLTLCSGTYTLALTEYITSLNSYLDLNLSLMVFIFTFIIVKIIIFYNYFILLHINQTSKRKYSIKSNCKQVTLQSSLQVLPSQGSDC